MRLTVPSCKVSTTPLCAYGKFYSVVTRRILQSMCLLCVLMMQTTLFRKVKWKKPFFTNVFTNTASAYYTHQRRVAVAAVISPTGKHFLKAAQQQWTQTYRDDYDAREAVLAQAKTCMLETTTQTAPMSVKTISHEEALHCWEEKSLAKKMEPQGSSNPSENCRTLLMQC